MNIKFTGYLASCVSAVCNSTSFPSQGGCNYLVESRLSLLNTSDAPEFKILVINAR